MDVVVKILVFAVLGITLLTANAWYIGLLYRTVSGGGGVVVAPIRVVGGPAGASNLDEVMARMLLVRLRSIMGELEQAQSALGKAEAGMAPGPSGAMLPLLGPARTVRFEAQLFEPTKIDLKVAGVDVGGLLPWLQGWFAQDRTLTFTASLHDNVAIVAGNIDALDNRRQPPIWISIENPSAEAIVDGIAYALIQRAWAKDRSELAELTAEEFRTLVQSVGKVSEINRRVQTFKVPARPQYAAVLDQVAPLAERIMGWNELTYFAATIADGAEDSRRALQMYQRLKNSGKAPVADVALEKRLKELGLSSLDAYRAQAADATEELNRLFGFQLSPPGIELTESSFLNVYWDGSKIHAPPGVEDIPDLILHEATFQFIAKLWDFRWDGQNGALASSYTDVLTSVVKQARLHQTAEQADWTIAPGAVAWITGKTRDGTDQRPLRSFTAPGTAYDDPMIGKDPQVAQFRDIVTTSEDQGGVHTNSGIPNKAFYNAAMKIGTEKAARIWIEALKELKADTDLPKASQVIQAVASRLHGDTSLEAVAVKGAWNAVGL